MSSSLASRRDERVDVDPWTALVDLAAPGAGIDLRAHGGPPDVARAGALQVMFDGCLFNRAELIAALRLDGDAGPAEIVAGAFDKWGDEAPTRIKASGAYAIWDDVGRALRLVRDPVGTYPFFFAESGSHVAFGVDAEPLLRLPWVSRAPNRAMIADHLSHRWLSWHETHYRDLSRVPAGHMVTWHAGRRSFHRFWYPVDPSGRVEWLHEEEALDEFQRVFGEAVGRCLRQGRAAIFLSGGFDSVSIAVAAAERAKARGEVPPIAASLYFPDPTCDERPVQQAVASSLGFPLVSAGLDEALGTMGLIEAGVEINRAAAMPMMNAWRPAYRALGDRARQAGASVTVTGEGGDEWLTVGPEYMVDLLRGGDLRGLHRMLGTILRSYDTSRSLLLYNMLWRFGGRPLTASWGRSAMRRVAPRRLFDRRVRQLESRSPAWVSPEPELRREIRERIERWTAESLREPEPHGRFGFYLSKLPGGFLHPLRSLDCEEVFQSRRRNGLRELQPYWDPDLIQLLCRIHPTTLDRGGRNKGLVRDHVARRFPGLGFERHRKVSASTFFSERMAAEGPKAWEKLGGVRHLSALGIVDAGRAESAARADISTIVRSGNIRVWEMLNLEAWVSGKA
jgi:asparagine synthetase B (glutamine-hydrolysing)